MPVAALNEAQHPSEKLLIFQTVTVERAELPSSVLCLWGLDREIMSAVCDRLSRVEP